MIINIKKLGYKWNWIEFVWAQESVKTWENKYMKKENSKFRHKKQVDRTHNINMK